MITASNSNTSSVSKSSVTIAVLSDKKFSIRSS
jgi:hypothetical protein